MRIELHCHSTCSDGSFAPADVASRARAEGAEVFCLTDHDTLDGYAATTAELPDATVLRGVELSCRYADKTVHLLLYGLQDGPGLAALRERLEAVLTDRRARLRAIVERLASLGIRLDAERLLISTHGHTPGRPDVARALVEGGHVRSLREAFDRYLHDGGPADVALARLSLAEGLALGRAAGARMSLAHPHTLRSHPLVVELFEQYRGDGLEGIEAFYGRYTAAEREVWLRVARRFDLVVTGGSDFHGDAVPEVARPVIDLPEPHAARLRAWLAV
jgi:predicted metal-dependent phosphoesterase TrpH